MPESQTASSPVGTWTAPQCPFTIEYLPRVLDDIRLAVMDAFFSLPRGGAEIGGLLLGSFAGGRLSVSDYLPLDCEHAFGPHFTLSKNDEAKLRELIDAAGKTGTPVGWYHSHTRSEIFLSDADLDIHRRFFPEPWQVALVLKPHTFQPMRGGFFFRENSGGIQAASSYQEFVLEALPVRPIPNGDIPQPSEPLNQIGRDRRISANTVIIDTNAVASSIVPETPAPSGAAAAAQTAPAVELTPKVETSPKIEEPPMPEPPKVEPPHPEPPKTDPPKPEPPQEAAVPIFGQQPERPRSRWLRVALLFCVGIAFGIVSFETRLVWGSRLAALVAPQPAQQPAPFASVGLSTTDTDGQLLIRWDRFAAAVRQASRGRLEIADSAAQPQQIPLDATHLQTGNFTYARQGETVNVTLTLDEPRGTPVHEISTFVGKLPKAPEASDLRKQRDAAITETLKLKQDLQLEADRSRRLQKALDTANAQLKAQQQKRLGNQLAK